MTDERCKSQWARNIITRLLLFKLFVPVCNHVTRYKVENVKETYDGE